jgi:hypothetical protein
MIKTEKNNAIITGGQTYLVGDQQDGGKKTSNFHTGKNECFIFHRKLLR